MQPNQSAGSKRLWCPLPGTEAAPRINPTDEVPQCCHDVIASGLELVTRPRPDVDRQLDMPPMNLGRDRKRPLVDASCLARILCQ